MSIKLRLLDVMIADLWMGYRGVGYILVLVDYL